MPFKSNEGVTAQQKEEKDLKKLKFARDLGYNVLEIWDSDSSEDNLAICLAEIERIGNGN
jgi:very-short-patch-repair endonuclease